MFDFINILYSARLSSIADLLISDTLFLLVLQIANFLCLKSVKITIKQCNKN